MFREKLAKNPKQRGYLYIRETIYQRDRRTLKRKPAKLCNGTATKERGKYSKKKDIYCGRIQEVEVQKLDTFRDYITNQHKDYLQFMNQSSFEDIVDEFVKYILYVYEIPQEQYLDKKQAFTIGDGYLSKDIIEWLKRFKLNSNFSSPAEMKRFFYRCSDCGIFDEDVINSLYLKVVPDIDREEIQKEIEEMQQIKIKKQEYKGYRDFMKQNQ